MFPTAVLHRSLNEKPLEVVAVKGQYLTLSTGQKVFDACGGAAVSCIGHGDPRVISAITTQLQTVDYIYSGFYTTSCIEKLSKLILRDQFTFTHALFVGSGSEAIESSLKLCRQYFVELEGKDTPRTQFISRRQSYHGTTLGALSVGGHTARRALFEPLLEQNNIHQISPCYPYRHQTRSEEEYTDSLIQEFVDTIESVGPKRVAAFFFEPVVGAALACVPATTDYIVKVRQVCDRYGILMVCDEVMCGMGRCTDGQSLHAWRSMNPSISEDKIAPDVQTAAKGLGGGYAPIGTVLVSRKVASVLTAGTGVFVNGYTYQAHPLSCAAALAVQTIVRDDKLLQQAHYLGGLLEILLEAQIKPLPHVGDVRGRGLFWGVEFVQDKETKAAFQSRGTAAAVANASYAKGVQVFMCEGIADGVIGDAIIIAPAYNCTEGDIAMIVDVVSKAIKEVFAAPVITDISTKY
jgi:adenosylmethionine-8-amino-7-oxononanoate aminotransferase